MQSLRGVTLPDDEVIDLLRDSFTVGWTNIHKASHVGLSHGYRKNQTAIGTTNGAGGRNVQLVVLAPDETVLHVLPGFWHPEDLVRELRFARTLFELWRDDGKSLATKVQFYERMHRRFVRDLPADTIARSDWQGFDRNIEVGRARSELRDTVARAEDGRIEVDANGVPELKPLCTLVHDRMLQRPFWPFAEFDMEAFVDYGRPYYDNNAGMDEGKEFLAAERANEQRERAKEKAAAEAAKEAAKEAKKAKRAVRAAEARWPARR